MALAVHGHGCCSLWLFVRSGALRGGRGGVLARSVLGALCCAAWAVGRLARWLRAVLMVLENAARWSPCLLGPQALRFLLLNFGAALSAKRAKSGSGGAGLPRATRTLGRHPTFKSSRPVPPGLEKKGETASARDARSLSLPLCEVLAELRRQSSTAHPVASQLLRRGRTSRRHRREATPSTRRRLTRTSH